MRTHLIINGINFFFNIQFFDLQVDFSSLFISYVVLSKGDVRVLFVDINYEPTKEKKNKKNKTETIMDKGEILLRPS